MTASPHAGPHYIVQPPHSWPARIALLLGAAVLAVLGFFFAVVLLVVAAAFIAILLVRWWWFARKTSRAHAAAGTIEGDYVVVQSDNGVQDGAQQPDPPRALRHGGDSQ